MADDVFDGAFTMNTLSSDERYDLAKFLEFIDDDYDAVNSPFLLGLRTLPVWRYYRVNDGYKDIDMISYDAYGTLFYSYLIQFYNDTIEEVFEEGTVLKLFDTEDLEELYTKVSNTELDSIV